MGKLTDDEENLLKKLLDKQKEPDAPDHEIEIYDTKRGVGARVPFSKGADWLFKTFGIGEAPQSGQGGGDGGQAGSGQGGGQGGGDSGQGGSQSGSVSYFGGRRTGS